MQNISVLSIVEEPEARGLIGDALAAAVANGLLLVDANAGARAAQRAHEEPFSCVLIGVTALVRIGTGFLADLLAAPHAPAVILLSREPERERATHFLANGAQDFLLWSVLGEHLHQAIEHAVARQSLLRAIRDVHRPPAAGTARISNYSDAWRVKSRASENLPGAGSSRRSDVRWPLRVVQPARDPALIFWR